MKVSIVVPIYNEAENIFRLHHEIVSMCRDPEGCSVPFDWEIIFVDDGSDDLTPEICRELRPLRYIRFSRNYGQTAALDCGFRKAAGDFIAPLDGDGQNDPKEIPRMLQYLLDHDLDVVCGWRKKRHDTFRKKMDSRLANIVRQKMVHDGIHDSGCTLKIIRRECLEGLSLYGDQHRFIPAILKMRGFRVGEIEVNHRARTYGKSKYNYKRLLNGMRDLTEIRLEQGQDTAQGQPGSGLKGSLIRGYYRHFGKTPYHIYEEFET